jgi:RNA 2',3'-cyclic 3'-phosphodiesterase
VRLFVAVEVGGAEGGPSLGAPEHLTLSFLGEVDPAVLSGLTAAIARSLEGVRPFDLVLEGIGAFPSSENPRVVWIGVGEGRAEVTELATRVRAAIASVLGPSRDERFVPHLTLFRVRSPGQRRRAIALLEGAEPAPSPRRIAVREVCLKESTLGPRGAQHRTRARFALEPP